MITIWRVRDDTERCKQRENMNLGGDRLATARGAAALSQHSAEEGAEAEPSSLNSPAREAAAMSAIGAVRPARAASTTRRAEDAWLGPAFSSSCWSSDFRRVPCSVRAEQDDPRAKRTNKFLN
jgi:hypothetical protein